MDFKKYWEKVDAAAAEIADEWPLVVGIDDPSRGLSVGCPTQVSREDAAKMIVENRGRLATPEEIEAERVRTEAMMAKFRDQEQERAVRNLLFPQARPMQLTKKG